jgi:c-di-GMP-binding flagellar brake protein YcgR
MESQERRQQQRFSLDLQVKISSETKTGEVLFHEEATTANISSSGAFILTDHKLPLAGTVQLEFFLALEDLEKLRFILSVAGLRAACQGKHVWVKATGVVIRTEEKGVGIIFDTDYQIFPMQPSESR